VRTTYPVALIGRPNLVEPIANLEVQQRGPKPVVMAIDKRRRSEKFVDISIGECVAVGEHVVLVGVVACHHHIVHYALKGGLD
jgi:hypothetical protein